MLRVSIHPLDESVLLVAQTRDRSGHITDATDTEDAARYGTNPDLGFSASPVNQGVKYPLVDIDREGAFEEILRENDVQTQPSLPGFYRYTMELGDPDNGLSVSPFVADPNDVSKTLWLYMGSEFTFESIFFQIAAAGAWTFAQLAVEYWSGVGWQTVPGLTEGSLLNSLAGASDQVSWTRPPDWFAGTIDNSLVVAESSRRKIDKKRFWVRVRLELFVGFVSLPSISGIWEGWPEAEADQALWQNVIRPSKVVLAMASMQQDTNGHLAEVPVVTRKQPAQRDTGVVDYGRGDYLLPIPTNPDDDFAVTADPGLEDFRTQAIDKGGASVPFPVPSAGVVLRKGHYRARVLAEIPNVDFSQVASETGHEVPPAVGTPEFGGTPPDPNDPEALFDPTWKPMVAATVAHFDVRGRNAYARVDVQRLAGGGDVYTLWVERDGRLLSLPNQGGDRNPYARLMVINQNGDAVIIDTMDPAKAVAAGPLAPAAGVTGVDSDQFTYTETVGTRQLVANGQYLLVAQIVWGGESFETRVVINFFT